MDPIKATMEDVFRWAFTNYPPQVVVFAGTFIFHELFYFGVYIPYFIADKIPALRKYKLQPEKENTAAMQWHCFFRNLWLHSVYELPAMWLTHYVLVGIGSNYYPPFPAWSTIALQICFFFFVEDFYFYWIHRLLHWGPFYKYIHKVHHEHSAPFGIAGEYAHPIETIFLGFGSVLGPFLLQAHLFTLWVWLFFRLWQVIDAHSGYDFPISLNRFLPFWGGAEFHDFHHMAFVGNYASTFRWWDYIFGTDQKYKAYKAKQLKEKANKAQ